MTDQILTVCTAAVPLLVSVGGVIRYLVRILASIERATELGQVAAEQIARHIEQTETVHARTAAQLTEHHGRISALEAKGHPA